MDFVIGRVGRRSRPSPPRQRRGSLDGSGLRVVCAGSRWVRWGCVSECRRHVASPRRRLEGPSRPMGRRLRAWSRPMGRRLEGPSRLTGRRVQRPIRPTRGRRAVPRREGVDESGRVAIGRAPTRPCAAGVVREVAAADRIVCVIYRPARRSRRSQTSRRDTRAARCGRRTRRSDRGSRGRVRRMRRARRCPEQHGQQRGPRHPRRGTAGERRPSAAPASLLPPGFAPDKQAHTAPELSGPEPWYPPKTGGGERPTGPHQAATPSGGVDESEQRGA